ncbi:MAG: TRAP transporter substrate-binding protein [Gammaproteobacteria bacterium]|nr:TRAP transporter substrate-binding protein [Gammaproteobacteria bacterium]
MAKATRGLRVACLVSAVALLGGCGGNGDTVAVDAIVVAGTAAPRTAGEAQWLSFARHVEEAGGADVTLRMLIHGQLGSEEQLLSGLRRGRVQIANLSALMLSSVVPEMVLLQAPYLFGCEAEADHVFDELLTPYFRDRLAEENLVLMEWLEIGFHHVYAKRPVRSAQDMAGMRYRVSSSIGSQLFARALGADVIPLGFADIVPSLQTGLIETGENSTSLYVRTGIAGEAPYFTLTAHAFGASAVLAARGWWEGLAPARRALLEDAFPAIQDSRQAIRAESRGDLADAAARGIRVHRPDAPERASWEAAGRQANAALLSRLDARSRALHEQIMVTKDRFAAAGGCPDSADIAALIPPLESA